MATKPVLIEYADGQRYVVTSAARAAKVHPNAKIVSMADGSPYEAPDAKPKRKPDTEAQDNGADH